jgi:hypothetical protein
MKINGNPVTLTIVSRRQRHGDSSLLLEAERFDKLCVRCSVFTLQVLEQTAALCNLFDQTAAGTKVLAVRLQVLGKLLDFSGQNGDLHLW